MLSKLSRLLTHSGSRYIMVGGSAYVLELLVIVAAQKLGTGPVLAIALSFCFGTIYSFALQKLITFQDKRMHYKILGPQFIAVCLLVLFNFGFTLLVAKIFAHILPAVVSRTIAIAITTIWNFYVYKTKVFKSNDDVPVY